MIWISFTDVSSLCERCHPKNSCYSLIIFQGTVEADRDGAVRISDLWRFSVLPFQAIRSTTDARPSFIGSASDSGPSRTREIEVSKANDMYAFGLLAWEVVDPLLGSNRLLKSIR